MQPVFKPRAVKSKREGIDVIFNMLSIDCYCDCKVRSHYVATSGVPLLLLREVASHVVSILAHLARLRTSVRISTLEDLLSPIAQPSRFVVTEKELE